MEQESAVAPVETLARRVREARNRKGLTAQQLAERLQSSGLSWDRGTVAKVETGRRQNISVVEWLALARALDVAPIHLLVPLDDERPYLVTPEERVSAGRARQWIRGTKPLAGTDLQIFWTEVPLNEVRPTGRVRFGGRHGSGELQEWAAGEQQGDASGEQEHRETPER
jgi:transcriptional regulator with XRE-family HTH domain